MIVYFNVLMNAMKSTKMINFDVLINITDQMFINTKEQLINTKDQMFINTKEKGSCCKADVLLQETISAKRKLIMSKIIDILDLTVIKRNIYFK
jgi:hypothetical protein